MTIPPPYMPGPKNGEPEEGSTSITPSPAIVEQSLVTPLPAPPPGGALEELAPPPAHAETSTKAPPLGNDTRPQAKTNPAAVLAAHPDDFKLQRSEKISIPPLRNLRSEIQDLQSVLNQVRAGVISLSTSAAYIKQARLDIAGLFKDLTGDYSDSGDTIRHIRNCWEQMEYLPVLVAPETNLPIEQLIPYLDTFDALCRRIVFYIASITVPERLNEWLNRTDLGYYIPFHMVFEDEIPNLDDRTRLLNLLSCTPRLLEKGKIYPDSGLVYRIALQARDWVANLFLIIVVLAATIGVVIGAAYLPLANWPLNPGMVGNLVASFAAVLVGIFVHFLIDQTKTRQGSGNLPPVFALVDVKRVLSAQVGAILIKLAMALVGFFGLIFANGVAQLTVVTAFLVGYSLDSFVGLFGTSAEERSAAQLSALKDKLQTK
jgi:hypothetical protein